MRTSDMVKSKFWRAADLKGQVPVVLSIADVTEELLGRGGKQDVKCFLWFLEHQKGLQLNASRVAILEAAYGPNSELWTGKRVRLSFDPTVMFGGQAVGGVKLQTPPGVVWQPGAGGLAGWGEAPGGPVLPPGAPPPPVWDPKRGVWVTHAPIAAPAASAAVPPAPVWNAATGAWEVVNPGTGEIHAPAPRPPAPNPQDATWGGAPSISQRTAAPAAAAQGWDQLAPGEDPEFGHADIPF